MHLVPFRGRLLSVALSIVCFSAAAQDESKNILIQDASEEVRFVKTKEDQPIQVRQTSRIVYACQDYRTAIPIAEFYNDEMLIDDVGISLNGRKQREIVPKYEYYNVDNVFYSDAHVCHFTLPFTKKGDEAEVVFEKTILDPRYFTDVYFTDDYDIQQKTITVTVPEWLEVEIKEYNFKGYKITSKKDNDNGDIVYTYTLKNAKAAKKEEDAPGPTYMRPHILVLVKEAKLKDGDVRFFKTLADQYAWYRKLVKKIGNDSVVVKEKALEIAQGKKTDEEKVKAIYEWVQHNIRYIAYEDGMAGFKPAKAQDVLAKKYGDCKGMGNLLTQMLRSLGYDARICWLGTNHIAYDYSTPCLSVDNHMICAWMHDGKTTFLDGTEKYIGYGEIAERIQGRQVLIENGKEYLLQTIPMATYKQNTCTEKRTLTVNGTDLTGHVIHTYRGENKETLLYHLDHMKTDKREDALREILSSGNTSYMITNIKTSDLNNYNSDLTIEYDLVHKNAFTAFGNEKYLEVDNRKEFASHIVDTAKRKLPLVLPFKDHTIVEVEINLPKEAKVNTLPNAMNIETPLYGFMGKWTANGNKLSYKAETQVKKTWVEVSDFKQLNADVTKLKEFYNSQPSLSF